MKRKKEKERKNDTTTKATLSKFGICEKSLYAKCPSSLEGDKGRSVMML